jgi:hypothetical protein
MKKSFREQIDPKETNTNEKSLILNILLLQEHLFKMPAYLSDSKL